MARPPKYSSDQILDAAAHLLATDGPRSLRVANVATHMGAPTGSIYHRFDSRDALIASLWLRTVERFQESIAPAFEEGEPAVAIRRLGSTVVRWARENPIEASLLLLHRSSDLLEDGWPEGLLDRNRRQRAWLGDMVNSLSARLDVHTEDDRRRVWFAAVGVPYAAVRQQLIGGRGIPSSLDVIVCDAAMGAIRPLLHSDEDGCGSGSQC